MDYINELDKALVYIEENLDGELRLEGISSQVNISPFHFHRIFKAVIHETVMEYVRSRRLTEAFNELIATNERIIDIALKYGFETQQSFSRAFKEYFEVTPGAARRRGVSPSGQCCLPFSVGVLKKLRDEDRTRPEIVLRQTIKIVGVQKFIDLKSNIEEGIATKAWQELRSVSGAIENRVEGLSYGLQRYPDDFGPSNNIFEYIAAVEVESFGSIPEGLIGLELPPRHYAVYTYKGEVGPETMTQIFANIYGHWILNLPYELCKDFDFEYYDARYYKEGDLKQMQIYIPVVVESGKDL